MVRSPDGLFLVERLADDRTTWAGSRRRRGFRTAHSHQDADYPVSSASRTTAGDVAGLPSVSHDADNVVWHLGPEAAIDTIDLARTRGICLRKHII